MTTSTPVTNIGSLKISDAELKYLDDLLRHGDRGGYYMALYNMTGQEEALLQAQIATFSEGVGGAAFCANSLLQRPYGAPGCAL